jgi:hypothetical protein
MYRIFQAQGVWGYAPTSKNFSAYQVTKIAENGDLGPQIICLLFFFRSFLANQLFSDYFAFLKG